jgi:hypothetical protein
MRVAFPLFFCGTEIGVGPADVMCKCSKSISLLQSSNIGTPEGVEKAAEQNIFLHTMSFTYTDTIYGSFKAVPSWGQWFFCSPWPCGSFKGCLCRYVWQSHKLTNFNWIKLCSFVVTLGQITFCIKLMWTRKSKLHPCLQPLQEG